MPIFFFFAAAGSGMATIAADATMHSAVNAALRHPCHKVEVFIVLVFNCFATPQRLFPQGDKVSIKQLLPYKYINIIQSPQQFSEILAPCRPFLLHLLTHRRIFKNLTPYISTPSIIRPHIRLLPRRRGEQSVQTVRKVCAECVSATGRRPIDGFGGERYDHIRTAPRPERDI